MPELYDNKKMRWYAYFAGYLRTYVELDTRELSQVGGICHFISFMTSVAARIEQLLNKAAIANEAVIPSQQLSAAHCA